MVIYDLENVVRDQNQDDLYNLFALTYKNPGIENAREHIVEQDEEMRIDLISYRLYGDVEQVGFLLHFNQLTNPLNIKEGDVIRYLNVEVLDNFNVSPSAQDSAPKILNTDKSTRKDKNREKFVENNYSIPPTLQEKPRPPVEIIGNSLVIGL